VPLPGPTQSRVHLRLAPAPAGRPRGDGRILLRARALAAAIVLAIATILAWVSTAVALVPVVWRRGPTGRRLRAETTRAARVIPFQPRRTALPR
jgi:hypothetical protein